MRTTRHAPCVPRSPTSLAALGVVFGVFAIGCILGEPEDDARDASDGEEVCDAPSARCAGGAGTIFDSTEDAFRRAMPSLPEDQRQRFLDGRLAFNVTWVAPQEVGDFRGLGPHFNAASCVGCHARDGRGRPYNASESTRVLPPMLIKLRQFDDDGALIADEVHGEQLRIQRVGEGPAQGDVTVRWETFEGAFPDGEPYELQRPVFSVRTEAPQAPPAILSPRATPPNFGLGLLENIPAEDILAAQDPADEDGDGVRGVARIVTDPMTGAEWLGRFGWKADHPTVRTQTAAAAQHDMGITSPAAPRAGCVLEHQQCDLAGSSSPAEMSPDTLDAMVFYLRHLAVPARSPADTSAGERHFEQMGCASCHTPSHRTSEDAHSPALRGQTIWPYTDLLLHDMGRDLAPQGARESVAARRWRTPPLWGLGLAQAVNGHVSLLHDGRARSIEEAILWHGGEASRARDAYRRAPEAERAELLAFLNAL